MQLTEAQVNLIESMAKAGSRPFQMRAAIPGLKPAQLSRALRKLKVPNFPRGRLENPAYTKLRRNMASNPKTQTQIGKDLGISRQRVGQIVNKR